MHHVAGTTFVTCRRHHPTQGNSAEQILNAHQAALAAGPAPSPTQRQS
jgi:hypothetical protein